MYFESRSHAGYMLASVLVDRYRYENCAVVALNDAAVLVGEQIAAHLHCVLNLLLSEDIDIPGEGLSFGAVSQDGDFTYNSEFTSGQIEGYTSEFHGYLSEQRRMAFSKLNKLVGDGGVIDESLLQDRVVILVSDAFEDTMEIEVAIDYLKPVRIQKLVVAAPIATVAAVDKLHVLADEMHILDVKQNFLATDHYYEDNTIPDREETIAKINQIILNWR